MWPLWVVSLWSAAQRAREPDHTLWGHSCVRLCLERIQPGMLAFADLVAGAVLATTHGYGPSVGDHMGPDEEDDGAWGISMPAVAHALRWRYASASYAFHRLPAVAERALRRGCPIALPRPGSSCSWCTWTTRCLWVRTAGRGRRCGSQRSRASGAPPSFTGTTCWTQRTMTRSTGGGSCT